MNGLLLVVAFLGALNPARTRVALPETDNGRARLGELALGSVVGFGVVAAVAGLSGPLLDALDVSAETFRIAAGLVLGISGVWAMLKTSPGAEPELAGLAAALWPVAFPRIVSPAIVALGLAAGSQEGVAASLASMAAALAALMALGTVRRRSVSDGVLRWIGAIAGVALVVVGTVLMIDGIRDV